MSNDFVAWGGGRGWIFNMHYFIVKNKTYGYCFINMCYITVTYLLKIEIYLIIGWQLNWQIGSFMKISLMGFSWVEARVEGYGNISVYDVSCSTKYNSSKLTFLFVLLCFKFLIKIIVLLSSVFWFWIDFIDRQKDVRIPDLPTSNILVYIYLWVEIMFFLFIKPFLILTNMFHWIFFFDI